MKASGRPNAIVAGVYKVDFRTMTQTNTRTRFQRPVWCSDGNAQAGAVEAAAVVSLRKSKYCRQRVCCSSHGFVVAQKW